MDCQDNFLFQSLNSGLNGQSLSPVFFFFSLMFSTGTSWEPGLGGGRQKEDRPGDGWRFPQDELSYPPRQSYHFVFCSRIIIFGGWRYRYFMEEEDYLYIYEYIIIIIIFTLS